MTWDTSRRLASPCLDERPVTTPQAGGINRQAPDDQFDGIRPARSPAQQQEHPGLFLAAAYGVVVLALLVRFVRAWHGLAQLKRASSLVVDPVWQATLKHWSTALRVGRPVELRMSDTVSVPMTFCWRAPVILIPRDCLSTCDQTQRDAIVVHELTHIARGRFLLAGHDSTDGRDLLDPSARVAHSSPGRDPVRARFVTRSVRTISAASCTRGLSCGSPAAKSSGRLRHSALPWPARLRCGVG